MFLRQMILLYLNIYLLTQDIHEDAEIRSASCEHMLS